MVVPDTAKIPSGHPRSPVLAVAGVTAAGLLLRVGLSDYSMWYDEFASVAFADRPLWLLWSDWMVRETNPPLFYSLLHGWIKAFGHSLTALRMLPVILGTIGIALVAAIAWIASGPRAAVLAGALTALSAQHIYYSHTVRAYVLAFDGVALALLGLVLVVTRERGAAGPDSHAMSLARPSRSICTPRCFSGCPQPCWGFLLLFWHDLWTGGALLLRQLSVANLLVLALSAWWLRMTVLQLQMSRGNIDWIENHEADNFW